jgi:hypothetical protein
MFLFCIEKTLSRTHLIPGEIMHSGQTTYYRRPRTVRFCFYANNAIHYLAYLGELLEKMPQWIEKVTGFTTNRGTYVPRCPDESGKGYSYQRIDTSDSFPQQNETMELIIKHHGKLQAVTHLDSYAGCHFDVLSLLVPYMPGLSCLRLHTRWSPIPNIWTLDATHTEEWVSRVRLSHLSIRHGEKSGYDVARFDFSALKSLQLVYPQNKMALPRTPKLKALYVIGDLPEISHTPLLEVMRVEVKQWDPSLRLPRGLKHFAIRSLEGRVTANTFSSSDRSLYLPCPLPQTLESVHVECSSASPTRSERREFFGDVFARYYDSRACIKDSCLPTNAFAYLGGGEVDMRTVFRITPGHKFSKHLRQFWMGTRYLPEEIELWPSTATEVYAVDSHNFFHPIARHPFARSLRSLTVSDPFYRREPDVEAFGVDFSAFCELECLCLENLCTAVPTALPDSLACLWMDSTCLYHVTNACLKFPPRLKLVSFPCHPSPCGFDREAWDFEREAWEGLRLSTLPPTLLVCDVERCSRKALLMLPSHMPDLELLCCSMAQLEHAAKADPLWRPSPSICCIAVSVTAPTYEIPAQFVSGRLLEAVVISNNMLVFNPESPTEEKHRPFQGACGPEHIEFSSYRQTHTTIPTKGLPVPEMYFMVMESAVVIAWCTQTGANKRELWWTRDAYAQ